MSTCFDFSRQSNRVQIMIEINKILSCTSNLIFRIMLVVVIFQDDTCT